MTQTHFTSTLRIAVEGNPLPDNVLLLLTEAFVDNNLRLPDMFVLRFRDPDRLVLSRGGIQIGASVALTVVAAEESRPVPLMTGEVTALEAEVDGGGVYTTVRGYDRSHRLMNGTSTSSYLDMTYSDIVRKVAQEAAFAVGRVDTTRVVHPFVARANTCAWDFLHSLADEIGFDLYVENGKLNFVDPTREGRAPSPVPARPPYVLRPGADLLRLRAAVTGSGQVSAVQVRSWDDGQQRPLVGNAPAPTEGPNPTTTPAALAERLGSNSLVVTHQVHDNQPAVDAAARAVATAIAGTSTELEGVTRGNPTLRAGFTIAIENLGAPFDGRYVLTRVRHVLDATSGYTTEVAVTGRQERSMLGLTGGAGNRGTASVSQGVVPAVVTNVKDPDSLGRVRVKFPWLADSYESGWARVAQPGAGSGYGAFVLPEVGDEVVVAFDRGSPANPIVLGGLYSLNQQPAAGPVAHIDNAGKVSRRALVTPSGSRLEIVDAQGNQGIWLKTGDGKFELGMAGKPNAVTLRSDGSVTVNAKNGVTIDAGNGDVKVTGAKVELRAQAGLTLNAGADVQIKGANLELAGNVAAKLTGTTVSVAGHGRAELKAPLVEIN